MIRKNKIVYLPYPVRGNKINAYLTNMVGILQDKYLVTGSLAEPADFLQMLQTKAVFLNWFENLDPLSSRIKLQLMLYKLSGARIIWVFHNKYPHDTNPHKRNAQIRNMQWLAGHSSRILLHSKSSRKYIPNHSRNSKKAYYIPHILYERRNEAADPDTIRKQYHITEDDFVFTIFGVVSPYKNIESGIEAFQKLHLKNAKLLIAGAPSDNAYAEKIKKKCQGNPDILLDLHYIPDTVLDNLITASDVIVMPYHEGSSMNSGVMIQSFSIGKPVITPDICMARDMASEKFMYRYRHSSLEKVMLKAYRNGKQLNRQMGERARAYVCKRNNRELVKKQLYKMLET